MEAICKSHDIVPQVLVRSVPTRWNSVTEMIERAVKLWPVISELCKLPEFNKRTGIRLRRFILSDEEWVLLESVQPLLSVCSLSFFCFVCSRVCAFSYFSSRQRPSQKAQLRASIKWSRISIKSQRLSTTSAATRNYPRLSVPLRYEVRLCWTNTTRRPTRLLFTESRWVRLRFRFMTIRLIHFYSHASCIQDCLLS